MTEGAAFHEGWIALRPKSDGVDITGVARRAEAGWFVRTESRATWVRDVTAAPDGGFAEVPAVIRLLAGPKAAASVIGAMSPLASESNEGVARWFRDLAEAGAGPLALLARTFDVSPLTSGAKLDPAAAFLAVIKPEIQLVDRSPEMMGARLGTAAKQLCRSSSRGPDAVVGQCPEGTVVVSRQGSTLAVGWGELQGPDLPDVAAGAPSMACTQGTPVAAARFDPASVFQGARGLGFLDALSNDTLAAFYGIVAEYGQLMRASRPAVALVCEDASGHLTVQARWRFGTFQ